MPSDLKAAYDEARQKLDALADQERSAKSFVALSAETLVALYPNDPNLASLQADVLRMRDARDAFTVFLRETYGPAMDAYFDSIGISPATTEVSDAQ